MKTFKHSGDLGDIIFSLPTIKELGGGILYLDPTGGIDDFMVSWGDGRYQKTNLTFKSCELIKPLLLEQSYIEDVIIDNPTYVDFNLNCFRNFLSAGNICRAHLKSFDLNTELDQTKWLELNSSSLFFENRNILIARTLKVQANHAFWEMYPLDWIFKSVFVGLPFEYEVFSKVFNHDIPFWELNNILDLARAINGCELFVSNQTLGHAIAEGLKKNLIQEYYRIHPIAIFKRKGAIYV